VRHGYQTLASEAGRLTTELSEAQVAHDAGFPVYSVITFEIQTVIEELRAKLLSIEKHGGPRAFGGPSSAASFAPVPTPGTSGLANGMYSNGIGAARLQQQPQFQMESNGRYSPQPEGPATFTTRTASRRNVRDFEQVRPRPT
jgi:hypothetical protein